MNRNSHKEKIVLIDAQWTGNGYVGEYLLTKQRLFVPMSSIDYAVEEHDEEKIKEQLDKLQ
jgi:flavorubredoxin